MALGENSDLQFWLFQGVGWLGLCVVTYLSLTLWYADQQATHVAHTLIQAVIGAALTVPLRAIYRRTQRREPASQLAIIAAAVMAASAAWTVLRLIAFDWLTGETDLWSDLGGWFFGSFMVFAGWTSLYFGATFYKLMRAARTRAARARAEAQAERLARVTAEALGREAELKMLRYQLNPHFLFNTLNAVSGLIAAGRDEAARQMIGRIGALLRASLDADPALSVPLAEEIETVRLYLSVEEARFGDRLSVRYAVDDAAADALVPSLLLQPIVENAVRYGVETRTAPAALAVTARRDDDAVLIEVADDGPGLCAKDVREGFGIGLTNTRERLAVHYAGRASLTMRENAPSGVVVALRLPYEAGARSGEPPALAGAEARMAGDRST